MSTHDTLNREFLALTLSVISIEKAGLCARPVMPVIMTGEIEK